MVVLFECGPMLVEETGPRTVVLSSVNYIWQLLLELGFSPIYGFRVILLN